MATETTAADIDWRWRSELLGEPRVLDLPQGSLRCFVRGEGPTVVFAHGWLANANLWRAIVQRLATDFTCVTLDLPLGGHTLAYSFTPEDQPERLAEILAAFAGSS